MSDSLQPHGLEPTRLLGPWNSPGKNTGVCYRSLLQGIFLTQGSNPRLLHLLHCRWILYHLTHQGSPKQAMPLANQLPCWASVPLSVKIRGWTSWPLNFLPALTFLDCDLMNSILAFHQLMWSFPIYLHCTCVCMYAGYIFNGLGHSVSLSRP